MARPQKCVTVEEARDLQENWKNSRGKEIERGQGYVDSREFWYSIEELQEYLDYVKEKSKEQGVKQPGIRIYFGAYPKSQQKRSFSTVFLAPTKEAVAEIEENEEIDQENNYEIEPLNSAQGGWPPTEY